jgi:hypothetical protein
MEQLVLNPMQGAVALATRIVPAFQGSTTVAIPVIRWFSRATLVVLRFLYRCLRRLVVWAFDWVAWANQPVRPKRVQMVPGLELEVTLVAFLVVVGVLNLFV